MVTAPLVDAAPTKVHLFAWPRFGNAAMSTSSHHHLQPFPPLQAPWL